jgi:hypothetical protein
MAELKAELERLMNQRANIDDMIRAIESRLNEKSETEVE